MTAFILALIYLLVGYRLMVLRIQRPFGPAGTRLMRRAPTVTLAGLLFTAPLLFLAGIAVALTTKE